jgi:hypothetical protein
MKITSAMLALIWLPVICFTACMKKKSEPAKAQDTLTTTFEARPVERLQPVPLTLTLAAKLKPSYTRCNGKLKVLYQDKDNSLPFTLHFKTERGVATTFTVTAALGVPVANGWIRNDSVYVDSKLGGQRIKEPLMRLTELTGLPPDLGVVESLLTGKYVLPSGFMPVTVTDTNLVAYPLPSSDWRLTSHFNMPESYPMEMELSDQQGTYTIRNSTGEGSSGPSKTTIVQADRSNTVQATIKIDVLQRKFE